MDVVGNFKNFSKLGRGCQEKIENAVIDPLYSKRRDSKPLSMNFGNREIGPQDFSIMILIRLGEYVALLDSVMAFKCTWGMENQPNLGKLTKISEID